MSLSQSLVTPSHLTLLTPHTHSSLPPLSRDGITRLGYQLLYPAETDPGLIEVGTDGTIRTVGINGHALVMVTTFESGFNRSVSLHVEVCSVASLALTPHPSLPQATPTSRYHSFPLGCSAEFTADLHDNETGSSADLPSISTTDSTGKSSYTKHGRVTLESAHFGQVVVTCTRIGGSH